MDEEANIYTLNFEKIGCAGDSDVDDDIWGFVNAGIEIDWYTYILSPVT